MESASSGLSDGVEGLIARTIEEYDVDARLFRQKLNANNGILTQLDDFVTGLLFYSEFRGLSIMKFLLPVRF